MSAIAPVFRMLWRVVDGFRKLLHLFLLLLIFFGIFAFFAVGSLGDRSPVLPRQAALFIAPQGTLVDQYSGDPVQRALARIQGNAVPETRVKDLIDAMRSAATDDRIRALVLQLDGMQGGGLSKLQRLAHEIRQFKTSGKPVIAIGDSYNRDQYYLAAQADEIFMHPMGAVSITGYGRYALYYKDLLDKLYIDYNVWTVGEYKSFVEPITRNSMSSFDKEASGAYLTGLWNGYQADVTKARKLPSDALQKYADQAPELLRKAGGDMAKLAVDYGLVDDLLERDAMRDHVLDAINQDSDNERTARALTSSPPFVGYTDYLRVVRPEGPPTRSANEVAVIVLAGEILDGVQPPGSVGGDSTARLIREANEDSRVKALVLHVDSPGGSAFAADVILHEIERFQATGRPVVVSMDSVAASGGYWVSMSADEIWANATTLTGSIGVGATVPTFQNALAKLGVHADGIGTTALSGESLSVQALGDNVKDMLSQSVRNTYGKFIGQVAMYRGMSVEDVDKVAQGRVWTGADAMERGLVDRLGTLDGAIASAAHLAGLDPGKYTIRYVTPRMTFAQRIAVQLVKVSAPVLGTLGLGTLFENPLGQLPFAKVLADAKGTLTKLARWNDPRGIYTYCFCAVQ